jgi:hypothetical protein
MREAVAATSCEAKYSVQVGGGGSCPGIGGARAATALPPENACV